MAFKVDQKKLKDKKEYVSGINVGSGISTAIDNIKQQQSGKGNKMATNPYSKSLKPKVYKPSKKKAEKSGDQKPKWYAGKGLKKLTGATKRRLNKLVKKGKVKDPSGKAVSDKYKSKLGKSVEDETGRIRRGAKKAVKTKGGTFPTYKKKSGAAKSFRDAFKQARAKGVGTIFEWDGRKYKAETAEDVASRKAPKKKMGGYQKKYEDGGHVGMPVATYANGGYIEGE